MVPPRERMGVLPLQARRPCALLFNQARPFVHSGRVWS